MESNQLEVIVAESGLESTKAKAILEQFRGYFDLAAEWEEKAKVIVVTDASQETEMKMARTGRLFLRDKRLAIERTRKELKEQSLREGKAIDGIANVLKALIVPIEEHLDRQEHYVEIKAKEAADKERARLEAEAQAKREAEEKAKREEAERMRAENERLRREADEREAEAREERMKAEAERRKAEQKARDAEIARKKSETEAARLRREVQESEAKAQSQMVECPKCHHVFNPAMVEVSS